MNQFNKMSSMTLMLVGLSLLTPLSFAVTKSTPAKAKAPITTTKTVKPTPVSEKRDTVLDYSYQDVDPLNLVKNPKDYLNKKVSFTGTFNSFDGYALNYDKALRSDKDYVNVVIRRPDATHHPIPLSELKLFLSREKSKQALDLEAGDKVVVHAKEFSTALNDPWLDVDEVTIIEKNPKAKKTDNH